MNTTALQTADSTAQQTPAQQKRISVRLAWLIALIALVLVLFATSLVIGSRNVEIHDVIAAFQGSTENLNEAAVNKRIPRTILALLAGAGLGLSGAVMQGVTRNPLADPGILGVNMGAALAVVVGIAWFGMWRQTTTITVAIIGASTAAVVVYIIGSLGRGGATPLKLALAGTASSAVFASFISAVVLPRGDISGTVRSWQIGGVGGAGFDGVNQALPFLIVGTVLCLMSARSLNMLALGDELAAGLGEKVMIARIVSSLGAVILCGAITAVCGPIGFVGLVVPHLCRLLIGTNHIWLLPFSALTGASLVLVTDIIGRVIARPAEVPVGIITALIGAPFFIYIVRRRKVREV